MRAYPFLQGAGPAVAGLIDAQVKRFRDQCSLKSLAPEQTRIVVSWGGGKDSTFALVLAKAIAEECHCELHAYTMYHPGLTSGVLANIGHIKDTLAVEHGFRQFKKNVHPPFSLPLKEEWWALYRRLRLGLRSHPRFMCVGCNLGAIVTEYSALSDLKADFHVTGNPGWELAMFQKWAAGLQRELNLPKLPDMTDNVTLNYYRIWRLVYEELLRELTKQKDSFTGTEP